MNRIHNFIFKQNIIFKRKKIQNNFKEKTKVKSTIKINLKFSFSITVAEKESVLHFQVQSHLYLVEVHSL